MKFNLIFAFVIACAMAGHAMASAMKGREFRKFLLEKLQVVRQEAEKYMDAHGLAYAPSEEYP